MTCPEINNQTDLDLGPHQSLFDSFFPYSQKTMGYTKQPKLNFASDPENAGKALGKTAHYDPSSMEITIYVDGRHIKDILRSVAHELIHHAQNERGEFDRDFDTSPGYALKDGHLWNMEQEAYKDGNSCFRRWEDTYKQENQLEEQKMITIKKKDLVKLLTEVADPCAEEQKRFDSQRFHDGRPRPVHRRALDHCRTKQQAHAQSMALRTISPAAQQAAAQSKDSITSAPAKCTADENCKDSNACTNNVCVNGKCVDSPAADDTPCGNAGGKCAAGACSDSAEPGAGKAPQARSTNRWAKRAKVGKAFKHRLARAVQTELIKNMPPALEESQVLTEEKRHPCTNAKTESGVDGWMGGATLKCLQSVPIFKGDKRVGNNLSVYKNMRGILRTLKDCVGDVKCVPTIGKPKAAAAPPPGAGAPEQRAAKASADREDLIRKMPAFLKKAKDAAFDEPDNAVVAKNYYRTLKHIAKMVKSNKPGALEHFFKTAQERTQESKSPLKPLRIKHYNDRNKRLFEHLIKKAK